jgi:SAM-dependent methyltransferase
MRAQHLCHLVCPACRCDLQLSATLSTPDGRVEAGSLGCSGCGASYPIVSFVPRFVAAENYASGFGFQWLKHARTQYDATSASSISRDRFFGATRWPREMAGERILEVGGGSGRFTEHAAATGAFVASLDYSIAVEANYASNGHRPNVLIVQADLYSMPFRRGAFDRCYCFGVLQHTPDVERAFHALPPMVRPGGELAVDVYRKPRGLRRLTATKYYVRPLTRRIPSERLYTLTTRYVRLMWPLARLLRRIPYLGIRLNWALLIPDYGTSLPLSDQRLREWAELDLFDMLAPAYDTPQDLEVLRQWFDAAGLEALDVHVGYNGLEGRGRVPSPDEARTAS